MSRLNSAVPLADIQSDHVDALDGHGVAEFDWESVYLDLDGEGLDDDSKRKLAEALRRLLGWLTRSSDRQVLSARVVGVRTLAMLWSVDPSLIDGSPSLRKLARRLRISRSVLSKHSSAASRQFGIRNRASNSHAWNFRGVKVSVTQDTLSKP